MQSVFLQMSCHMTKKNPDCAQRRLGSAWASAQSDQSLRYALNGYLRTQAFFMQTAKTLIRVSDWTDAKADLSLRWAHRSFVGFVMRWLKCACTAIQCCSLSEASPGSLYCVRIISRYTLYTPVYFDICH